MLITWSFLVQWSKINILSTVAEFVIYHYYLWGFKIHNGKLKKKPICISTFIWDISNSKWLKPNIRTSDSRGGGCISDNCHISKKPEVPRRNLTKQWCPKVLWGCRRLKTKQNKNTKPTFCTRIFPLKLIPEIIDKYPKIILKSLKMNHSRYSYHYFQWS